MILPEAGAVAVIFVSQRRADDGVDYAAAAQMLESLATEQPGYLGIESLRDASGMGITISYWQDEESALLWRDHPNHAIIRDRGRAEWYDEYATVVTRVTRAYGWVRPAG